jgi:4-amino-4-deoxy-L-arabinose transferase-like glycosyltransferase
VSFAGAVTAEGRREAWWWGSILGAALAAGTLVKGPIAVVLPAVSVLAWLALTRRWRLLARVRWLPVCVVFVTAAMPWYVLAERATPGFLRYFLINEHVLRYLKPEYGDLYGSGNQRPWGTVWAFLAAGGLPWTGLAVAAIARLRRRPAPATVDGLPWLSFTLLWGIVPAVFFTAARQVEPSYPLPGVPGLALAAGAALVAWGTSSGRRSLARALAGHLLAGVALFAALAWTAAVWRAPAYLIATTALCAVALAWLVARLWRSGDDALIGALGVTSVALLTLAVAVYRPNIEDRHSAVGIIARLRADPRTSGFTPDFPLGTPYSAGFYSSLPGGKAVEEHPDKGLPHLQADLRAGDREVFVFRSGDWASLDTRMRARLRVVERTGAWVACLPAAPPTRPEPVPPARGGGDARSVAD